MCEQRELGAVNVGTQFRPFFYVKWQSTFDSHFFTQNTNHKKMKKIIMTAALAVAVIGAAKAQMPTAYSAPVQGVTLDMAPVIEMTPSSAPVSTNFTTVADYDQLEHQVQLGLQRVRQG
jgi:hypothetical protein